MLLTLSEVFETPVSTLLGETVMETPADPLRAISEKLGVINLQLAKRKNAKEKTLFWLLISFCAVTAVLAVGLYFLKSPYLGWNLSNPEFAVLATAFHVLEWLFARIAPVALIAAIAGAFVIRKKA